MSGNPTDLRERTKWLLERLSATAKGHRAYVLEAALRVCKVEERERITEILAQHSYGCHHGRRHGCDECAVRHIQQTASEKADSTGARASLESMALLLGEMPSSDKVTSLIEELRHTLEDEANTRGSRS